MWESAADLRALQDLLDASAAAMTSPQLHHVFPVKRHLRAEDVVALFPDRRVGALATVTARGEPRVAPVDLLMLRSRLLASTRTTSWRARHLAVRPAVSVTYYEGDDIGLIAHGRADVLTPGTAGFDDADAACRHVYGSSALEWSDDGCYLLVHASRMFAHSRRGGP
jgi:hypothetical protein